MAFPSSDFRVFEAYPIILRRRDRTKRHCSGDAGARITRSNVAKGEDAMRWKDLGSDEWRQVGFIALVFAGVTALPVIIWAALR